MLCWGVFARGNGFCFGENASLWHVSRVEKRKVTTASHLEGLKFAFSKIISLKSLMYVYVYNRRK